MLKIKNIKKSIKNSRIYLLVILLLCASFTPIYAMKRSGGSQYSSSHKVSPKKIPKESLLQSSATQDMYEISSPEIVPPPSPKISPAPPSMPPSEFSLESNPLPLVKEFNPLEVFSIMTFYNHFNACITLRVDPKRNHQSDQKLTVTFLEGYLESYKSEMFDRLRICQPLSTNIFKIFDIICIDKRIKTDPDQLLNSSNWLIFQNDLNATVYINKKYLEKRQRIDPNILEKILSSALYI